MCLIILFFFYGLGLEIKQTDFCFLGLLLQLYDYLERNTK